MSIIGNLIKKTVHLDRPLDILTFFYDGKFDIELLKTGHNLYGYIGHSVYNWPGYINRNIPNLHLLNSPNEYFTREYDMMMINSREAQKDFLGLSRELHLPCLVVDHDYNMNNPFIVNRFREELHFPSISTNKKVGNQYKNEVIQYGIKNTVGEYEKDIDILICGNFADKDIQILHKLKNDFPNTKIVGENPSIPYSEKVETFTDYIDLFKRTNIFVNLPSQSALSYELLWALKYNCLIVTVDIPTYDILENLTNCLKFNDIQVCFSHIKGLLNQKSLRDKLLTHQTDLSEFDENIFISKWKNKLEEFRNKVFIT